MSNLDKIDIKLEDLNLNAWEWACEQGIILESDEKDYVTVEYDIDNLHGCGDPFICKLVVEGHTLTEGEAFKCLCSTVELELSALASDLNEYL